VLAYADRVNSDEFLTVAEIAATLKLNQQTVRNWLDAGRIPHYRLGQGGRRVRIRRSDFDPFMASVEPERAPVARPPSIWDGSGPMPTVQR
jgi:excisionase family DNA binding protein